VAVTCWDLDFSYLEILISAILKQFCYICKHFKALSALNPRIWLLEICINFCEIWASDPSSSPTPGLGIFWCTKTWSRKPLCGGMWCNLHNFQIWICSTVIVVLVFQSGQIWKFRTIWIVLDIKYGYISSMDVYFWLSR
jgi:hypothetical protein